MSRLKSPHTQGPAPHGSRTEANFARVRHAVLRVLLYVVAVLIALIVVFPVYWTYRTAAVPPAKMYTDAGIIPKEITGQSYLYILTKTRLPLTIWNTMKVAVFAILLTLVCSSFAAYRFARGDFPGKRLLFYLFLGTMMIPGLANLVPLYVLIKKMGMMDTHLALVLLIGSGSIPVTILILKSFVETVPRELDDSAFIDGCGKVQVYRHIILPLMTPGLAACSIISFIDVWNAFIIPLTFVFTSEKRLVMPAIRSFVEEHHTQWTLVMASCGIAILPVVVVFLFLQKYFIEGMTRGAIKY